MSQVLEKLTMDVILHSLNEKWGDGWFYDYEVFPNSNAKYSHSAHYKSMIDQLVKEGFVEKKGGKCTGGLYVGNLTIRNGKYCHLLLRITSKGHQYTLKQKAKKKKIHLVKGFLKIFKIIQFLPIKWN